MFSLNIAAIVLGLYSIPSNVLLLREVQPNNTLRDERMFSFFSKSSSSSGDESCSMGENFGICISSSRCKPKGGETISASDCPGGSTCCRSNCTASAKRDDPCVITKSGTTVARETGINIPYRIRYRYRKPKGICQLRLDFDVLMLDGPTENGDCNTDVLTAGGLSICGSNNEQHVYLDYGESSNIDISVQITSEASRYGIRNTFIACNSDNRAPEGCLQYYKGMTGTVRSFNFVDNRAPGVNQHLNNQMYSICVKAAFGMNRIRWRACPGTDTFFVSNGGVNIPSSTVCPQDFVQVFGEKQHCGKGFQLATSSVKPFMLAVNFDEAEGISIQLPTNPSECPFSATDPYSGLMIICETNGDEGCTCNFTPPPEQEFPVLDSENTGFCLNYFQLA